MDDLFSNGITNVDLKTGIHYGVINQRHVLQAWVDSSKPNYGTPCEALCPECGVNRNTPGDTKWGDEMTCPNCETKFDLEIPDMMEPYSFFVDDGEYTAECGEDGDIFITKSPYYTRCRYCSPCAPGAGYLMNPDKLGIKAYCFGPNWFEDGKTPYTVYLVKRGGKK